MNVIIPARFGSARLPGKPLADVAGKPLLERVYQRAQESGARRIVIATDDERIRRVAERFGATVCMTSVDHLSGTDRLGEVIEQLQIGPDEIVVNLQGDEPLMRPELIREVAAALENHRDAVVATACYPIRDESAFTNPNIVKVVCDARGYALYFSRAPIPWPRARMSEGKIGALEAMHHIGLYAYRAGFVGRYCQWGPCSPEQAEQLEQLRVLWHGERIFVCVTEHSPGAGVDTPEDLERVRAHFLTEKR